MKKLLALILAMLLPLCACAECSGFSFIVTTDETAFIQLMKDALLLADPTADASSVENEAKLLQYLINGFGVNASAQADAFSLELLAGGQRLIDLVAYETEEEVLLTSAMLPGYVLVEENTSDAEQLTALNEVDWLALAESACTDASEWFADVQPTESRGAFDGDAYEGGAKCTTWVLTDKDVAALLSAIATEDVRNVLTLWMEASGMDAADVLRQFDEKNAQVAQEGQHSYMLRLVSDGEDALVGASLTVLNAGEQLATASLGFLEEGLRLVVGLGLNAQNYWWEFTANEKTEGSVCTLYGTSREWAADKQDGFSYVSAAVEPAYACVWQCSLTETGDGFTWLASVTEGETCVLSSEGTADASSVAGKVAFGPADAAVLTVEFRMGEAEAIAPMADGLTRCSISDPADAALYNELTQKLVTSLTARLLKVVPLNLLMTLGQ